MFIRLYGKGPDRPFQEIAEGLSDGTPADTDWDALEWRPNFTPVPPTDGMWMFFFEGLDLVAGYRFGAGSWVKADRDDASRMFTGMDPS